MEEEEEDDDDADDNEGYAVGSKACAMGTTVPSQSKSRWGGIDWNRRATPTATASTTAEPIQTRPMMMV